MPDRDLYVHLVPERTSRSALPAGWAEALVSLLRGISGLDAVELPAVDLLPGGSRRKTLPLGLVMVKISAPECIAQVAQLLVDYFQQNHLPPLQLRDGAHVYQLDATASHEDLEAWLAQRVEEAFPSTSGLRPAAARR